MSSWERDEYRPDTSKLIRLAEILGVSVSLLVEEETKLFKTKETVYDYKHMKTYLKTTARNFQMPENPAAIDFAIEAHEGQKRKKSDVPYIYHPLIMACHALSMGIKEDAVIAAILLHDVIEDCGKEVSELPVSDEAKEIVRLVTHEKTTDSDREAVMDRYYAEINRNPKACAVKCIDRCNTLTTMSWGSQQKQNLSVYNRNREVLSKAF